MTRPDDTNSSTRFLSSSTSYHLAPVSIVTKKGGVMQYSAHARGTVYISPSRCKGVMAVRSTAPACSGPAGNAQFKVEGAKPCFVVD